MANAKVIAIANQKGGVAKTTTTLMLADILVSQYSKTVLIIDFDPQSSLSISCGCELEEGQLSMYNVLIDEVPIEDIILCNICGKAEKLCLAPADITLSVAEMDLYSKMARENILKKALLKLQTKFDYIFIDCCPSLSLLTINALTAAHSVLIPTSAEYLAYRGLKLLKDTIERIKANELNARLYIEGVVITQYNERTLHNQEVKALIETNYNLLGTVSSSTIVRDAVLQAKSLFSIDEKHKISQQYLAVAKELIKNE